VARAPKYHDAAVWALRARSYDETADGIHAARFGRALGEFQSFSER